MAWERRRYREHKVWALVDEAGRPVVDARGLASVRYQPDDARTYTVRPADIRPLESTPASEAPKEAPDDDVEPTADERPILVWIHGHAEDDAGPAGVGVVLAWRDRLRELSRPLRAASAWEAELAALLLALKTIRRPELPVVVHGAHAAALGEALRGRGPHADSELGRSLRDAASRIADLSIEEASPRGEHSRAVLLAENACREASRRDD